MATISFDHRSIMVNGQREILVSGAVHYPRSTPEMWPKILRESKAAGLNCIETYVFWEGHEPEEGCYNFSGRYDLRHFLDLCQQEGLYVILRIGPYICAEWNFGGLPWWLIEKAGMVSRTYNQPFMEAMERWVRVLLAQIGDRQITHGGPIILAQMENEYNNISKRYGEEGQRYLAWAGELGQRAGLQVPLVMCYGASDEVIETTNGFIVWKEAERLMAERPCQPTIWTENWPGWYNVWGQPRRLRQAEEIAYEVMRFFAVGGTGVNYYMWHGGTNFGRDAMYLQTTSYDFDAPLDEYGLPTTKSRHLQRLHTFLHAHASFFVEGTCAPREQLIAGADEGDNDGVSRYAFTMKGEHLVFITNATREAQQVAIGESQHTIPGRSALAYLQTDETTEVRYRSWKQPEHPIQRTMVPTTPVLQWEMLAEPEIGQGLDAQREFATVSVPHNMLLATRDATDYGWYRTTVDSPQSCAVTLTTRVSDFLSVWVNGGYIGATPETLKENRPSADDFSVSMDIPLQAGRNELCILVTALGMIKGDWMIDAPMSEERKGLLAPVLLDVRELKGSWEFSVGTWGERVRLYDPAVASLLDWHSITPQGNSLCWYRASFTLDEIVGDAPWALQIGDLLKGTIWVNGRSIGRYWQQPAMGEHFDCDFPFTEGVLTHEEFGGPAQSYYHIPTAWLRCGSNTLVILEERGQEPTGTSLVRRR